MKKSNFKPETQESITIDQFIDEHDYGTKPLHMTKSVTGWTKNNLLLDAWNQWLAWEEKAAEKVGPYAEGQGWRSLGEYRRYEQLLAFKAYFDGYCEGMEKSLEEERKQNAVDLTEDLVNSGVI